jgi:acetylornithine deacetylase/succinyl-diaminopimelate desuccinylase-like protein
MNTHDTTPPSIPFNAPDSLLDDGLQMLQSLIRIDTTNPPGNEDVAADQAAVWLEEVGIGSQTHDAAPRRRSLKAVLGPDDDDALVLSAHLDVVPADPEQWRYPPFSGTIAEDCVWGRGAIDMKHMAAYGLAILRQLARDQSVLKRGVKLVLVADEEAGCSLGSLHIAEHKPDWLRGRVALTEVGGFTIHVDGNRIYPIQLAEKGFVWMRLHIKGTPGHGSMPHKESAINEMARLVQVLADQPFPFRCTQPVADFLGAIGDILGFPKGAFFKAIGNKNLSNFVLDKIVKIPDKTRVFRALLRDTISPTMATAGTKINVLPANATLTIDCRILPGTDPKAFVDEFKTRVPGNYDIEVLNDGPALVMDNQNPILSRIEEVLREADPGCHPVPQMISGFTDARAFAAVGVPCYGFSPIWMPADIPFAPMFHGHNERIPVHGFRWGLATLYELVRRECT